MLKLLNVLIAFTMVSASFNSIAEAGATIVQQKCIPGTHYEVLDTPVRTSNPAKIEATEVFWYGCGHCYTFEPIVSNWKKSLADDVVFVKTPAIWHPSMTLHAKAFYAAKSLQLLDTMNKVLFEEMNLRKNKLASEGAIAKLFIANGVDPEKFTSTFNSFGVNSAVQQAESRQRSYQITGTPEMVVNGKYRITARMAGSQSGMLKVANHLIDMERTNLLAGAAQQ